MDPGAQFPIKVHTGCSWVRPCLHSTGRPAALAVVRNREQLLILDLPVVSPLALGIQKALGLRTQKLFSLLKIQVIFENESIYFSTLFFPMFSRNCFKNTLPLDDLFSFFPPHWAHGLTQPGMKEAPGSSGDGFQEQQEVGVMETSR